MSGKLIWRTFSIEANGKWYTEDSYKELEQKLSDSEADWLKMRDIAEETQRKLEEALKVVRFYASTEECWDEFQRSNDDQISVYIREDDIGLADVIGIKGTYQANHYGKRARDFLAKIEGAAPSKKDELCNHQWQYFASGHALCLDCEETRKPVKFPPNKDEV